MEDYTAMPAEENSVVNSWYTDPNEPRYCICDDVSYGEMVGCDNEDVRIQLLSFFLGSFCRIVKVLDLVALKKEETEK